MFEIWDTSAWTLAGTHKGHSSGIDYFSFSPDSRILVTVDGDTMLVWNTSDWSATPLLLQNYYSSYAPPVFTSGGNYLVFNVYAIFDTRSWTMVNTAFYNSAGAYFSSLKTSADKKYDFALASNPTSIVVFENPDP